jgi:hypothetical protein
MARARIGFAGPSDPVVADNPVVPDDPVVADNPVVADISGTNARAIPSSRRVRIACGTGASLP